MTLIVDKKTISVSQNNPDAFRPICLGFVFVSYITVTANAKSECFPHKWLDLAWVAVKLWLQYNYRQSFSLRKTTICIETHLSETVFDGSYPTIPWLGRQLWHKEYSQVTEFKVLKSESSIEMHKLSSLPSIELKCKLKSSSASTMRHIKFFNSLIQLKWYFSKCSTTQPFLLKLSFRWFSNLSLNNNSKSSWSNRYPKW